MCGICAIASFATDAENNACDMLKKLRHRGYDSCGICEMCPKTTQLCAVRALEGYPQSDVVASPPSSYFCIGHTRYTTQGSHDCLDQAQPILSNDKTIALVHNGQIEMPHDYESSDTHYMVQVIHNALSAHASIEDAFRAIYQHVRGSFACVMNVIGRGMFAFRDTRGIRPLVYTRHSSGAIFVSSESCALPGGGEVVNVNPGEVIHIDLAGQVTQFSVQTAITPTLTPCLFEFIYLAHDDSVIDGICVQKARETMGSLLVPQISVALDVIVPIPHTPVLAGRVMAQELGVDFVELLQVVSKTLKHSQDEKRRESRTFILPTQTSRENAVETKFSINREAAERCRGKRILLVDDSIVRGTTLKHVIKLIKSQVQPAQLFVASLAPPIVAPNVFGIDIPSCKSLVAAQANSMEDIPSAVQQYFGVDGPVIYQSLEKLKTGLLSISTSTSLAGFEDSVFHLSSTVHTRT